MQPGLVNPGIIVILTSATHIRPSPALLSEKLTTTLFCCSPPIDRLKQEALALRSVNAGPTNLNPRFDHVDWDMFRIASNNIDEYADSVSEVISKCIGDVVPTATIKTFPNQKPWIDGSICAKLKVRTTAFNQGKVTGNMAEYTV